MDFNPTNNLGAIDMDVSMEATSEQARPQETQRPLADIPDIQSSTMHRERESFRELTVKVHIRRPGRDAWSYLGRAFVTQEIVGHSSRVVVRSASSGKVMTTFSEVSDLQAEKRGNFVVVGCIENSGVVSWSLNALNNSETLRLLASIELACYKCRHAVVDPRLHSKTRRRIERVIKDDRRSRHRRRKEDEKLIEALEKTQID